MGPYTYRPIVPNFGKNLIAVSQGHSISKL